jgi:hypothetical protein
MLHAKILKRATENAERLLQALERLLHHPAYQDSTDPALIEDIMRANRLVAEIRHGLSPSATSRGRPGTRRARQRWRGAGPP